jgi:hypothetical protein
LLGISNKGRLTSEYLVETKGGHRKCPIMEKDVYTTHAHSLLPKDFAILLCPKHTTTNILLPTLLQPFVLHFFNETVEGKLVDLLFVCPIPVRHKGILHVTGDGGDLLLRFNFLDSKVVFACIFEAA